MKIVLKACPCVLRLTEARVQVLVFEHPLAGWQIPKGTVEEGEAPDEAALRELYEESGIADARIIGNLGVIERITGGGPDEAGPPERHLWHLYHMETTGEIESREGWTHDARGSEAEEGLRFSYFWFDIHGELSRFHPFWEQVFAWIRGYLAAGEPES
jgi:8-oxo-dGTP pyrophosphatase MutT (NUDIX family)